MPVTQANVMRRQDHPSASGRRFPLVRPRTSANATSRLPGDVSRLSFATTPCPALQRPPESSACAVLTVQRLRVRQVLFELLVQILAHADVLKHPLKFRGVLKTARLLKRSHTTVLLVPPETQCRHGRRMETPHCTEATTTARVTAACAGTR